MGINKYMFEHDDPYKLLAFAIVGQYRPAEVLRILDDDGYILNRIIKETREQDMCGNFTDCIIEDILEQKERMKYMKELDHLAEYYFSKLDKDRLRKELRLALAEVGIELDGYSTAGNMLSDNT